MRIAKILCLALVIAGFGAAQAAVVYDADLMPDAVVPESGSTAFGQATLIVNDDETFVNLTVNFDGLDSAQTGAALIVGAETEVGTMLVTLPTGMALAETLPYTPEMADALENDLLAIQIYSEDWPDGAIRGNFSFVTVEAETNSWTQVKSLF